MMCLYKIQKRRNREKDHGMVGVVTGVMSPQAKDSCDHHRMGKAKKDSPLSLQKLLVEWGPWPVWIPSFPVGLVPSLWLRRPLLHVNEIGGDN